MSASRISGAGVSIPSDALIRDPDRTSTASTKRAEAIRPVVSESFITSQVASRQPPRMALSSLFGGTPASATVRLFAQDLEALAARDADTVSGDLAAVFLDHVGSAGADPSGEMERAFDSLGELLRSYEHLRILRTGELG